MRPTGAHLSAIAAGVAVLLSAVCAGAQEAVVPQHAGDVHLGVATCASATCHGAATPVPAGTVLQNEYTTWQTEDPHSEAYNVLFNEQSQRIARNLGLPDAHTAEICLNCHSDNVPAERRGDRFQLSDGVGCEACHGGAERYIGPHTEPAGADSHHRNLGLGLYPTPDPMARAQLCLSCHFGDETKFVTHRIMGAGHPRMSFELDTFTAIEPAHYVIDEDYAERKAVLSGVQTWAIGQSLALVQILDGLLDPARSHDGIFPEPVFFDCYACHKPMSAASWRDRPSLRLGPGVVRINDSNLIMLRVAASVVAPDLAERISRQGRAMHQASQKDARAFDAAARELRGTALQAADRFAQHEFTAADLEAMLAALVDEGVRGEYIDYAAAEQTTMALGSVLETMRQSGMITDERYAQIETVMDDIYASVAQDERYRPASHLSAIKRLESVGQ